MQQKYGNENPFVLKERTWIAKRVVKSPRWCSVDLRDGNQALINPMTIEQKVEYFLMLVEMGFKEIEIAFPSASDTEFMFVRKLIEEELIPDDVFIQVTVQARVHLIDRTFEAVKGAKNVIMHVYNSTSTIQREIVFNKSREEIIQIALTGVNHVITKLDEFPDMNVILQYSPESFESTEIDFALEIVNEVIDLWQPKNNLIINLPLTMEVITPIEFADRIEFMHQNMLKRDQLTLCVHTHNDRGGAIVTSEFAMQAGADRIEGTLFGNGERTGNADLIVLALNLYSHGIDPHLNVYELQSIIECYEKNVGMTIDKRHPYAGELVFTAFSGSHQDAIRKGMQQYKGGKWNVPYLAIDPLDVGRTYEQIIRINSQSGKGGVVYVLEKEYDLEIPKQMHVELGHHAKQFSDQMGVEVSKEEIYEMFKKVYTLDDTKLIDFTINAAVDKIKIDATIEFMNVKSQIKGVGNGSVEAFINSLAMVDFHGYSIKSYHEHAIGCGTKAVAVTYVQVVNCNGDSHFGVGIGADTTRCVLSAVLAAIANLEIKRRENE